jgi:hypothetical protein
MNMKKENKRRARRRLAGKGPKRGVEFLDDRTLPSVMFFGMHHAPDNARGAEVRMPAIAHSSAIRAQRLSSPLAGGGRVS